MLAIFQGFESRSFGATLGLDPSSLVLRHDRIHSRKVERNCGKDDRHFRTVRTSSLSGSGKYEDQNVEEEWWKKLPFTLLLTQKTCKFSRTFLCHAISYYASFSPHLVDDQPEVSCAATERDLNVSEMETLRQPPLDPLV